MPKLTFSDKTNPVPIVDRTKQATAEDFNEIKAAFNDLYDALTKLYGADGRIRFNDADKHWYFEVQESPNNWVEKFQIGDSAIVDVVKFIEGPKPTVAAGDLGVYNKKVTLQDGTETLVLRLVDPNQDEYVFVVYDIQNDRVISLKADGSYVYVPQVKDLDNFIVNGHRDGDNLILTTNAGGTVTVPFGSPVSHTVSVKDFSLSVPSRVVEGTDLNKTWQYSFNIQNHQNVQTIEIEASGGTASVLQIPNQDGHITGSVTLFGQDTSSPVDLTFKILGLMNDNTQFTSNTVHVQVYAASTPVKDIYYGASSASDPAMVNLATLTKVAYVHPGQEFTFKLTVGVNDYAYIFVPHDPGLSKIFNTTFGDTDVTTDFSTPPHGGKTENAQTVDTIPYDSYRRGPSAYAGDQDLKVVMQ